MIVRSEVPEGCADFDNVVVRAHSHKALRVELDDGALIWVPKSVIADESEVFDEDNGEGRLIVQEWWAEQKGLM